MEINRSSLKFKFTSAALAILEHFEVNPATYGVFHDRTRSGLVLRNMGKKVTFTGRGRHVSRGEPALMVSTGIIPFIPEGWIGLVQYREQIANTGITLRPFTISHGDQREIMLNIVNMGEKEIVIETGAVLPFELIVVPSVLNFEPILESQYLRDSLLKNNKNGEKDD